MVFAIVASLFSIPTWVWPEPRYYLSIGTIGIFGLIGQVYMTKAFQTEETSVVAPFKYMELVYSIFLTYFFFGETHNMLAFLGMGLIMGGMLLNIYFKKRESRYTPTEI